MFEDGIKKELLEGAKIRQNAAEENIKDIGKAASLIIDSYKKGKKLLLCGNGGSAADSQHIAAELVGRFKAERRALPAIALTTDTSILTALANDYGYAYVFKRQLEALGNDGDVLLALSTSGNSENILEAVGEARRKKMHTIALAGRTGGKLKDSVDVCIRVPAESTDRIQEMHIAIGHILCDILERELFTNPEQHK